jgi:serine/threonine-protein kinase
MSHPEQKFGPFILKEVIGQGGMGKVYKAYDPINHRLIALKVIKDSLLKNPKSKKRFLQEAFIHAKLSHPSIIPIHSIESHPEGTGYSMPFIQGATLKTHLVKLKANPSYMPLKQRLEHVIKILEALDYTHKMGYIHRDVKADNIFIGLHNDTYLFDWGLACKIGETPLEPIQQEPQTVDLTSPGKIPGTLTHLAPERALGNKGSIQSDLFSLGVVLYQLLTMKMPFFRKDLNHFKQVAGQQTFPLPSTLNLKEDIDEALDLIVSRALATDLDKRYKTAQQFIHDLQKVLSGRPVWKDPLILELTKNSHWLYQDMLPLGSYLALSQKSLSWGLLSVPYVTLVDNYKIFISTPHKFKLYLNLAKDEQGFNLDNCYILAVDSDQITLHRVFAKIDEHPINLNSGKELKLTVEKIEQHFYVWLGETLMFDFVAKVPSICPHIGLVVEDTDVKFSSIYLYNSSCSQQVSCLKLGDNLVWHRCFNLAREEYKKIFYNFQDHQEGRDALFRYSYSYILEAKHTPSKKIKLLNLGIKSFEQFRATKSSPWEYWGKALCYEALGAHLETIKCFELGFRKYPKHIFCDELKEELVSLFSQKSIKDKKGALHLAFVALKYLDEATFFQKYPTLIDSLEEELAPCFVLLDQTRLNIKQKLIFSLAYLLNQKLFLEELFYKSELIEEKTNALLILCHLNSQILKIKFFNEIHNLLKIPHLLKDPLTTTPWVLARLALALYGHKTAPITHITTQQEAFFSALLAVVKKHPPFHHPLLDPFDHKIVSCFKKNLSKVEHLKILKGPFFQESERFVRSNFIISLIEKKSFDYFGYDKACLEFAIKALF